MPEDTNILSELLESFCAMRETSWQLRANLKLLCVDGAAALPVRIQASRGNYFLRRRKGYTQNRVMLNVNNSLSLSLALSVSLSLLQK